MTHWRNLNLNLWIFIQITNQNLHFILLGSKRTEVQTQTHTNSLFSCSRAGEWIEYLTLWMSSERGGQEASPSGSCQHYHANIHSFCFLLCRRAMGGGQDIWTYEWAPRLHTDGFYYISVLRLSSITAAQHCSKICTFVNEVWWGTRSVFLSWT